MCCEQADAGSANASTRIHNKSLMQTKSVGQPEARLKRFDRVVNVCEFRDACGRYAGDIRIVNVVIEPIEQIQEFGFNAPMIVDSIADFRVEQRR